MSCWPLQKEISRLSEVKPSSSFRIAIGSVKAIVLRRRRVPLIFLTSRSILRVVYLLSPVALMDAFYGVICPSCLEIRPTFNHHVSKPHYR